MLQRSYGYVPVDSVRARSATSRKPSGARQDSVVSQSLAHTSYKAYIT